MLKTSMQKRLIVDIETIGCDFDSLDEISQEYILKNAETDEERQKEKDRLALSPLTGEIVAIGMLEADSNSGAVYFQSPDTEMEPLKEGEIKYVADTEEGILKRFWEVMGKYNQIITFNGRGFDAPYLILRSAIHKIRPTKDLMPYRYSNTSTHLDLYDHLTFYGSARRKCSLHMCCTAFGIKSPKEEGVTGNEVGELFKEKQYLDIAKYCVRDLHATKELYEYWDRYIKFSSK
jgi:DNA polymerase elongation subunit (family B)